MTDPILSGLALVQAPRMLHIRYPERLCPRALVEPAAAHYGLALQGDRSAWRLAYESDAACPQVLKAFFARVHGYPPPYPRAAPPPGPSPDPLVSCIVLVNENALFVQEQLLPSLAAHAGGVPLEVVLVRNRPGPAIQAALPCRVVDAPWGAVAAGYNAGARAARGAYLCFLHDDCVIDDPAWIAKCRAALDEGASAASAEYRQMPAIEGVTIPGLLVAKCVPLFIAREAFFQAGGYDEFHYLGYEDLDFTLALLERGLRLAAVDLRARHYGGMSSTLKYCGVPGLAALHAMTAVPTGAIRQAFREYAAARARDRTDLMPLALDVQKLYVLKKYRRLLCALDAGAHAQAVAALERRITEHAGCDPHLILPRFREQDRAAAATGAA